MQTFEIPEDFARRVLARRGKRHVFDRFQANRTALIVIDLQNAFMDETVAHSFIPEAREIVAQVNGLAEALRARGGLVVWVRNEVTEASQAGWAVQDELITPERRAARINALTPGSRGYALWHELAVDPRDPIVGKTRPSAFIQGLSALEALLRARAIDTLLVTGTNTGVCCEMTAKDAMMLGFRTIMVSDACAAADQAQHESALLSFYRNFGDVMTSAEVRSYLQDAQDRP
jgi:ureidoacrylate peracid hydrolase